MPTAPPLPPLAGLTIVELGHSVAAPYAGLILADLGARVIKVENPDKGDHARGWGPPHWNGTAATFHCYNRGKEGIAIDLGDADEAAQLRRLIIDEADAVIQNLRAGVLSRYGLDGASLRAEKPGLIWCDIGAFGEGGPLAAKPGYDPLMQASTGIMSITGEHGRPPVRVGVSLVDMGAGMWTVIGLLSALIARAGSGQGAHVQTSLYETGLAWMTAHLAGFAASGEVRRPYGSGVQEVVPYQAFETRQGWLMIAAGNDGLFRKLTAALGLAELASDPRFATNSARILNREAILSLIAEAVRTWPFGELQAALDAAGVPNAPIQTVDQVARHAQTEALGMLQQSAAGELALAGIALSIDGVRPRAKGSAPALGEHNETVLGHSAKVKTSTKSKTSAKAKPR